MHTILTYLLTQRKRNFKAKKKFANKRRSYPEPKPEAFARNGKHFELGFVIVRFLWEVKTFAPLNGGLRGRLRPAGLPHAHPRIFNILGHGSGPKLMAISLRHLGRGPGLWPGPKLIAKAFGFQERERGIWEGMWLKAIRYNRIYLYFRYFDNLVSGSIQIISKFWISRYFDGLMFSLIG